MVQEIIIWALFGLAAFFVARKIYSDFSAKEGCAKGCGNCEIALPKTNPIHSSIKSIK